ncbi:hypothetical protein QJ857_gp0279 [Tupanvirus soda lake]|uniref:Transmembrane protein n=2 Tax=Tupanvirus TaxID=2094720 RepID=A0A6N1NWP2_9VIRU|nr:hypothetical protein QJ857_gp0279 [Tupanvirus soda lake]QKU35746.1 hypothetical protein [Tupanvirus soda lake]
MKLDTWHIVLIIIIVILLIWIFSSGNNSYETFNQQPNLAYNNQQPNLAYNNQQPNLAYNNQQLNQQRNQVYNNQQPNQTLMKLVLDHMFYERLLMITYFTDKQNLHIAEAKLVRNIQELSQYIKIYYPRLSALSNYIDKEFVANVQPYFDLAYQLYHSIETNDQTLLQQSIQNINTITNAVAIQFDRLFGTDLIQRYATEYMKIYVPSIYAFLSGDQLKDTQYMHAMFKMGFDMVFILFNQIN